MRSVDDNSPLTVEEAVKLIEFHTVKASASARVGSHEAAQAHGAAVYSLRTWLALQVPPQRTVVKERESPLPLQFPWRS